MTNIPTPQQVIDAHRPILRLAVEALRQGTLHAQTYADWMDEDLDQALAPALVRKEAKRQLLAANQDVGDDEDPGYETEFLSNIGIALRAPGVHIRLLRSASGNQIPAPGHSMARQHYYYQPELPLEWPVVNGDEAPPELRLVLHWSTADEDYDLDRVYLACPRTGGVTRETVRTHWDEPIWRRHGFEIDGQEQAEVTDLDIYLEDEATRSA